MNLPPRTLRYRSVHDLNQAVIRLSRTLSTDIDLIVGVPRSGLLAASLLALHMHRPVVDLSAFLAGANSWSGLRLDGSGSNGPRRVLVIDDTVNSGTEMDRVREAIAAAGKRHMEISYAAVYASPGSKGFVDAYAEVIPVPRVFEWNIMNHKMLLANACMDIDGVLCPDPHWRLNDDGPKYRKFMSDAELRYKPSVKVGALVTSRLEKYRPETEAWLARHGVDYGELIMLDLPTAEERRRLKAHAPHKAKAYQESGGKLFIESSADEGRKIFELTGLPVFVTDTREFFGAGADPDYQDPAHHRAMDALKALVARSRS